MLPACRPNFDRRSPATHKRFSRACYTGVLPALRLLWSPFCFGKTRGTTWTMTPRLKIKSGTPVYVNPTQINPWPDCSRRRRRRRHYNLQTVLDFFRSFLHSSRFMAVAHQLLTPSILASFPTSSLYLARGFPAFLSPSGCICINLLGTEFCTILVSR
jgi:hypothetical protein